MPCCFLAPFKKKKKKIRNYGNLRKSITLPYFGQYLTHRICRKNITYKTTIYKEEE